MNFNMQNLENVRQRLANASELAHRDMSAIRIVAVSKKHPAQIIRQLFALGQVDFGENQVQEALKKQDELSDLDICWHFIGTVQSNKTRDLATRFSWVQSVDREKILKRLSEFRLADQPALNICLQVNIDREPQKSGLMPESVLEMAKLAMQLPRVRLRGLMAIPKASHDPAQTRDSFRRVRQIHDQLRDSGFELDTLSMGMSADMDAAVAEGSTMVRIGTDIFGPRPG